MIARRLICIDPSLSEIGIAMFEIKPVESFEPGSGMRHLLSVATIVTKSGTELPVRLRAIHDALAVILSNVSLRTGSNAIVLIEEPAIAGAYDAARAGRGGRVQANAASMMRYHNAAGVIIEACAHCDLTMVRANKKKAAKRSIVERAIREFPPTASDALPRRKLGQDKIDALALGVQWPGWETAR